MKRTTRSRAKKEAAEKAPVPPLPLPAPPSYEHPAYLGYRLKVERKEEDKPYGQWESRTEFAPVGIWKERADVPESLHVWKLSLPTDRPDVYVVYHVYEHGDSFGNSTGDWEIDGAYSDEQEALRAARSLKEKLVKRYERDYFGRLTGVYVYSAQIKVGAPKDRVIEV